MGLSLRGAKLKKKMENLASMRAMVWRVRGVIVEGPSTNRAQTALAPIRGLKLGELDGAGRCQFSTKPYPLGAE